MMKIASFLHRENNNLDLIRMVLACVVIVGHAPILNGPSNYWTDPIGYFFTFTYSAALAVKLFFFISGMVVTNSLFKKKSILQFVIARVFRLIPALFVVLVVTEFVFGPMLTSMTIGDYFHNLDHFKYIHDNLLFKREGFLPGVLNTMLFKLTVNGSLWTLAYEIGCYIGLLGLFLVFHNFNKGYWKYIFLIILIDTLLPTRYIFGWLGDEPDVYLLPIVFSFGALLAIYSDKIQIDLKFVTGMFLLYYLFSGTDYAQLIFVLAMCGVVVCLASNKYVLKIRVKNDISYGIYLWGFLIQQTLYHFFGHLYVGFHCLLAIAISVVLAWFTHVLIEKPFMRMGQSVYRSYKIRRRYRSLAQYNKNTGNNN